MINTSSTPAVAKPAERVVEIFSSFKVKQLRQQIKDDLGIKDKVSLKIYIPRAKAEEQEEVKEGDYLPPTTIEGDF